jgi:hypothetical protein
MHAKLLAVESRKAGAQPKILRRFGAGRGYFFAVARRQPKKLREQTKW